MSRVACSVHTKASGDHRASTRCVSRILACALRRDTMAAAAALYVSPLLCTPWTGGANGERLAFLPNGRFLRLPLFLTLFAFFSPLFISSSSSECIPLEGLWSLSRGKFPFLTRDHAEKFHRARRLLANGGGKRGDGETLVGNCERRRGGIKVCNVVGREIASFPNPLCVF